MRKVSSFLFLVFFLLSVSAQDFKLGVPIRFDIGACYANMEETGLINSSQGIGVALDLRTGIQALYKDRVGMRIEGGYFLNSYFYMVSGLEYNLSQWDPRLSAQLFALSNPLNKLGSRLHVGVGLGYTFYSRDAEFEENNSFRAFSYTADKRILVLEPEIGLVQLKSRSIVHLLLAFTAHLDSEPGFVTLFDTPQGSAKARSRNNSLSLRMRFTLPVDIRPKMPPVQPGLPQKPSKEFSSRNTRLAHRLETKRESVLLKIRDIADEDGDTISVSVNGRYILYEHEISHKTKRLRVPLREGENKIVVYAHNEGRVPPNTARCVLVEGWRKKRLTLTTSLNRNQSIEVVRLK